MRCARSIDGAKTVEMKMEMEMAPSVSPVDVALRNDQGYYGSR